MARGPEEIKRMDEEFWRGRELNRGVCSGQPCCTMAGMSMILAKLAGNFAVVIHGERDCVNASYAVQEVSGWNVYCTGVTQREAVMGRAAGALAGCLDSVLTEIGPRAVFVFGTCITEMTGEDYERTAREAGRRHGIPVFALRTSGLKSGSQPEMMDWLYSSLAALSLPAAGRASRRKPAKTGGRPDSRKGGRPARGGAHRLNIMGLKAWEYAQDPLPVELKRTLGRLGLEINGSFPGNVGFSDWENIFAADATFVVDSSSYPRLVSRIEDGGMPVRQVPLPVGLGQSLTFYETIADHFGLGARLKKMEKSPADEGRRAIEEFRRRHRGKRLAYAIRMTTNYMSDVVAYDGLGELAFFLELGFDAAILVQGPTDEKSKEFFAGRLKQRGFNQPMLMFSDPWLLPAILKKGRFDLAYLADHARKEAAQAGVPMMQHRSLQLLLDSVANNVHFVEQLFSAGPGGREA